jgi:hypothetical protein
VGRGCGEGEDQREEQQPASPYSSRYV